MQVEIGHGRTSVGPVDDFRIDSKFFLDSTFDGCKVRVIMALGCLTGSKGLIR
jgi:hypothetical protein